MLRRQRYQLRTRLAATLLAVTPILVGGCEDESECVFPAVPAGASSVAYACAGRAGTGTADDPYGSISEAVASVPVGGTVLVAAGTYVENVAIDKSVSIVGSSDPTSPAGAAAFITPPAPYGITVDGAEEVTLQGLSVVGAGGVGIWLYGGSEVTIAGARVQGTVSVPGAEYGYGVLVAETSQLMMHNCEVVGSTLGVLVATNSKAIIDDNKVAHNSSGGIWVEGCAGEREDVQILRNDVAGNTECGIAMFESVGIIDDNKVADTALGSVAGDGILVGDRGGQSTDVHVLRNDVAGNARVGVIFAGEARGIIDDNKVAQNFKAGVWLQQGAGGTEGVAVTHNELTENTLVGVGLYGSAYAIIDDNKIAHSLEGEPDGLVAGTHNPGDGVALFAGASALVQGNDIADCFRAGVFTDGADGAATSIAGNTITGNDLAIVLQAQIGSPVGVEDDNVLEGNVSNAVEVAKANAYKIFGTDYASPAEADAPQ